MIAENIQKIKGDIPSYVKLVAISKTRPVSEILEAYNSGHKVFGENKVRELVSKFHELPKDIEWHMVGHLQTNKVKDIAAFVSLIHSVDSVKLLEAIDKEAQKKNREIHCLFQVHIADETTKFGFDENELFEYLNSGSFKNLKNINIMGLMGMATFTTDIAKIRNEFRRLSNFFKTLKSTIFKENPYFTELSMGMSSDYQIGIDEGSTIVRLGSIIFGEKN